MNPKNEMGVIVLFSQEAGSIGFKIESIQAGYPDAIISRNGQIYRAEFEYKSSSFFYHKHDPLECDLIICWEHDDQATVLPVIELSSSDWKTQSLTLIPDHEKTVRYWKAKVIELEKEIKVISRNRQTFILEEKNKQLSETIKELEKEIKTVKLEYMQKKKPIDPCTAAILLINWKGHQMGLQSIKSLAGGRDDTNRRRQQWMREFINALKKFDADLIDITQLGLELHSEKNEHQLSNWTDNQ